MLFVFLIYKFINSTFLLYICSMSYINSLNTYLSDILTDGEPYRIKIKSTDSYIYVKIILSDQTKDAVIIKFNRNISRKGYYFFENNCPNGKYTLTKNLKLNLLDFLKERKIFNRKIKI